MIVFDFLLEKPQATYDDYRKTPEGGNYQLIGGEIIEITSPTPYHQEILQNLNFYLSTFIYPTPKVISHFRKIMGIPNCQK